MFLLKRKGHMSSLLISYIVNCHILVKILFHATRFSHVISFVYFYYVQGEGQKSSTVNRKHQFPLKTF